MSKVGIPLLGYAARKLGAVMAITLLAALVYAMTGYLAARSDAAALAARADALIANGRGASGLGPGRVAHLLLVEDPGFTLHSGIDLSTRGAGLTTVTQSVAKRVGFARFEPGIMKLRLMGYAVGLEHSLSKDQILALFLETAAMGRGRNGWMTGFYSASAEVYGRPPSQLDDHQFLTLVAVGIAPRNFTLVRPDPALAKRVSRIERLVRGQCHPDGVGDVWLDGCGQSGPV